MLFYKEIYYWLFQRSRISNTVEVDWLYKKYKEYPDCASGKVANSSKYRSNHVA